MTQSVPERRKPAKIDTERVLAEAACARHLKDLEEFHGSPPADVRVPQRLAVRFVAPIPPGSWCTSPAQLCAELAE